MMPNTRSALSLRVPIITVTSIVIASIWIAIGFRLNDLRNDCFGVVRRQGGRVFSAAAEHFSAFARAVDLWQQHCHAQQQAYFFGGSVLTLALLSIMWLTLARLRKERHLEGLLWENEERLALAIDAAQIGTWEWNPATDRLIASARAQQIWGRALQEDKGILEDLLAAVHPDDIANVTTALARARVSGATVVHDFRVVRQDGSVLWVSGRGRCQYDESGAAIRMHGTLLDITHRRQQEAELTRAVDRLRNSESRYRQLFDANPQPMWVYDVATLRFLMVNDAAIRHYGYTRDEFRAMTIAQIRPAHDVPRLLHNISHIDSAKVDEAGVWQHRKKDGTLIDVEITSHVLDFEGRRAELVLARDISRRRKAAIALQRANRALRTLSAASEELVHATSERELLHAVCRVVVTEGGYRTAAVGYAENDADKTIRPMAWNGMDEAYIANHVQTWADTELGQRPISRAIRSAKTAIARNIPSEPAFSRWRDDAMKRGYVSNAAFPLLDEARVIGVLNIYACEAGAFDADEIHLLEELANSLAYGIVTLRTKAERDRIAHEHRHHEEILRKSLEQSIQAIADTVEMRDPYTAGHQRRVSQLAAAIAAEMGLEHERINGLRFAAMLHDLGKISIPAEILAKPKSLSPVERMLVQSHPKAGYEIMKDISFPWPIADIILQHHERMDGSGYPSGLRGDALLLEARILAVADTVEAMAGHRPYRASLGIEAALKQVEKEKGIAYDASVTNACLRLFRERRFAFR